MSLHNNRRPASLRYSKARPNLLQQPAFWGSAILISVVGLSLWEYCANPDMLSAVQNEVAESKPPTFSSPQQKNSHIYEHKDSLPVLSKDKDFEQSMTLAASIALKQKTSVGLSRENRSSDFLQDTKVGSLSEWTNERKPETFSDTQSTNLTAPSQPATSSTDFVQTPLWLQAQNQLQASRFNNKGMTWEVKPYTTSSYQSWVKQTPSSSIGTQVPTGINQNQSSTPLNPVQPVLNQTGNTNPKTLLTEPQAAVNNLGQSLATSALPSQNSLSTTKNTGTGYNTPLDAPNTTYPANSYTYSVQPQSVPSAAPYSVAPYSAEGQVNIGAGGK